MTSYSSGIPSWALLPGAASTVLTSTGTTTEPTWQPQGDVPVGSIIGWHKSFANTPSLSSQWKECDGSVLSDAGSVYNGQTLPNMNGNNNFVRGSSTSGTTGGALTHNHGGVTGTFAANETTTTGVTNATDAHNHIIGGDNHEPPYFELVWIIKIK